MTKVSVNVWGEGGGVACFTSTGDRAGMVPDRKIDKH